MKKPHKPNKAARWFNPVTVFIIAVSVVLLIISSGVLG